MRGILVPCLATLCAGTMTAATPSYTVSGAGNASVNGIYLQQHGSSYVAASGMQLFHYEGRWFVGKDGTGPVLYQGACESTFVPSIWSTYMWKGHTSPLPLPTLAASQGAQPPTACPPPCTGYTLTHAGTAEVNGCYDRISATLFQHAEDTSIELSRRGGSAEWVIRKSAVELYVSNCPTSILPPADAGWHAAPAGKSPDPRFSATVALPLGYCAPVPPPAPKPHPRCATPECVALHGPLGCPDLNGIAPDLVRPPMETGPAPAAGKRVRVVAPGFEHTQVYHPLYLPSEWKPAAQKYPVIVEYMGNGPYNDGDGDISTGRPEDSNLGWGMAEPAGTKYIWISMPMLSADLGNNTEVSTYWWGCPSSDAGFSCGVAFNITPTITYLHSALNQAFELYNGDPARVVVTGWSRGAIATGALGLYDDATSALFKAFVPYSHLDGDCGWVDQKQPALGQRWDRLAGRPMLYLGECAVATKDGPEWLQKIGQNGTHATSGMQFMTTGFANHNDAWVLRNSTARAYMRSWLAKVL